jgi:hypothetical protein
MHGQISNKVEPIENVIIVSEKSIFYHPFSFLAKEYGNDSEKLLMRLITILGSEKLSSHIQNKKIRKILKIMQWGLTIGILGTEFVMHIRHYIDSCKDLKNDSYMKRKNKILKLLKTEDCYTTDFSLSPDLVKWILWRPKTTQVKILEYYQYDLDTIITDNYNNSNPVKVISILLEFSGNKYLWDIVMLSDTLGGFFIDKSELIMSTQIRNDSVLFHALLKEFVNSLDVTNNIIRFDHFSGFKVLPRRKMTYELNQINMDELISEIDWILQNNKKWTYGIVGRPGTGKSSILRTIEDRLRKYIIFHLGPEDFENSNKLRSRFKIIKMFQPAILFIEDLDSCDVKEKNKITGTLLECIDEVNKDLNIVILYSVNDTSLVHYTIINRPGRSDRVIEVLPPKTIQEALFIINSRLKSCTENVNVITNEQLKEIAERCIAEDFTQADIANAVIEQAFLLIGVNEKNNENLSSVLINYLNKAIDIHLETRKAIRNCDFSNSQIMPVEVDPACEETEALPKSYCES